MSQDNFSMRIRTFLDSESTGHTSYILAEIASSDNGNDPYGTNMLTIADCRRSIRLEFFLGNAAAREESRMKAHALANILTAFRIALEQEIELIESPKPRGTRRRSRT